MIALSKCFLRAPHRSQPQIVLHALLRALSFLFPHPPSSSFGADARVALVLLRPRHLRTGFGSVRPGLPRVGFCRSRLFPCPRKKNPKPAGPAKTPTHTKNRPIFLYQSRFAALYQKSLARLTLALPSIHRCDVQEILRSFRPISLPGTVA
ncbi:hypothetical protein C8R43DRAFT_616883 [Mycena crocata]|nr:hypothetical protein C8R43DRAFT_616883 [Mycena crocata]